MANEIKEQTSSLLLQESWDSPLNPAAPVQECTLWTLQGVFQKWQEGSILNSLLIGGIMLRLPRVYLPAPRLHPAKPSRRGLVRSGVSGSYLGLLGATADFKINRSALK